MARGQQLGVDAALSTAKSEPASSAATAPAPASSGAAAFPPPQARWSLLLDADLRDLVDGGSFAVKLAAIAVTHNVRVWSSDCSSHGSEDGVEIFLTGEAGGVAAAKLEVADALVAACCFPDQPPAAVQVKEPPPPPMPAAPYPAPAYVDWSQAATPWAPWTMPAPPPYTVPAMPSALAATPYMDFSGFGMTSPDMFGGNSCYGMTSPDMFTGLQPGSSAALDMQVVHYMQQIPHSLVGLVIGVKGASIHAVEVASQCHLSLDRGCVFTDPGDSMPPYVLLHIHGQRCGAMQAIAMVAQILQRHVHALQSSPPCLAIDSAPEHAAAELPGPQQPLVDNETMRQDIMRALFAEPAERCVSPPPMPSATTTPVTPLPVFPTSLIAPTTPASFLRQPNRRRRLSAPSPADTQQFTPLFTPPQR